MADEMRSGNGVAAGERAEHIWLVAWQTSQQLDNAVAR
jgi:hypothetical protein